MTVESSKIVARSVVPRRIDKRVPESVPNSAILICVN